MDASALSVFITANKTASSSQRKTWYSKLERKFLSVNLGRDRILSVVALYAATQDIDSGFLNRLLVDSQSATSLCIRLMSYDL